MRITGGQALLCTGSGSLLAASAEETRTSVYPHTTPLFRCSEDPFSGPQAEKRKAEWQARQDDQARRMAMALTKIPEMQKKGLVVSADSDRQSKKDA